MTVGVLTAAPSRGTPRGTPRGPRDNQLRATLTVESPAREKLG